MYSQATLGNKKTYNEEAVMWRLFYVGIFLSISAVNAEELAMPKSAEDIVRALSPTPTTSSFGKPKGLGKGIAPLQRDNATGETVALKTGALIQFEVDSATIPLNSHNLNWLGEYGKALQGGLAEAVIEIVGHTDSDGSDDYNMGLSLRRAQAVRIFLMETFRVEGSRLLVSGKGELLPVSDNVSESGKALNRRVEFVRVK
jgi:outer membrane protein OmpA-like peptidoglycan-associated protein